MPSSMLEKLIRFLLLLNPGMWVVDFIEFAVPCWLAYQRKIIEAEEDILVEVKMDESAFL